MGAAPDPGPGDLRTLLAVVCGVRVEAAEDPLMRAIRQPDKLVDELANWRALEKVLRG